MQRIAMVGSGELSDRLIYYFEDTGFGRVIGMFDDFETVGAIKDDRPILGKIEEIPAAFRKGAFDAVAIAVGYKHRRFRGEVFAALKGQEIPIVTFVHPSSYVEKSALLQEGAIVLVDCTIDMHARIGENVLLSSRCFVSHHVKIGAHTFCGPAVNLAGHAEIGEVCFLGISTTCIDGVRVGRNVQAAAGSVITKDVPDHTLVAGVPAVVKKTLSFDE
jgi:sugar O-acyltransferase (sialic acid O-acetyltransferase NeuD family)